MSGAKGALVQVRHQFEATFRNVPSPAAFVMPHTEVGIERTPNRQQNNTANSSPLANRTDKGDPTVAGPYTSILELRSIGRWLKGVFGAPTTGKAVTKQPTNVTGVTIHYASSDCTQGNGTLDYTNSGTTLAWTPQGGTAGTAVDVSAGGNFTLEGGGGGKSIRVTVVAGSLPAGDESDADIAVSATLKAHAFPINTAVRPSALLEVAMPDISKYQQFLGVSVNTLSFDVLNNEQNISLGLLAAVETDPIPSSAFDSNPTSYSPVRACSGKGKVYDGSTGLGTIVDATVELNNNMTPYQCADGQEGAGFIDNGELMIGGSIKAVFDGEGAYAIARNGSNTRLRIESSGVNGSDTFKLVIDGLDSEILEKAPPRTGKSGLFADLSWKLVKGLYVPEIYLVNDVASY